MTKFKLGDKVKVLDGTGSSITSEDVGIITEIEAFEIAAFNYRVTVSDKPNKGNWILENKIELIPVEGKLSQTAKQIACEMILDVLAEVDQNYLSAIDIALFTVKQILKAIPSDVVDEYWHSNQEIREWERVQDQLQIMKTNQEYLSNG